MEASAPWRPASADRRRRRPAPDRLRVEPLDDRSQPSAGFLLATSGDVTNGGAPGLGTWTGGTALRFGDPNLALEPGTTGGTFSALFDLNRFTSADVHLDGLHLVRRPLTVGAGANTFTLLPGDLLLTVNRDGAVLTGLNRLTVDGDDVFVFRPAAAGDYASGWFLPLLDGLAAVHGGGGTRDIALVETDTAVGDVTLPAGSFLYVPENGSGENSVHLLVPTGVGPGATAGSTAVLIDGNDLGISPRVVGIELVEAPTAVGGRVLPAGTLLLALDNSDDVGGAGDGDAGEVQAPVRVTEFDVFTLSVTRTTLGSGTTAGTVALLLQGADVGLNGSGEAVRGLSLTATGGPPVGTADAFATPEDTLLVVPGPGVLANDSDPDGDPLAAVLVSGPQHGTLTLNPDGSFTYLPDASYNGPDAFTYRVTDGQAESADVVVSLTVTPINDPPVNAVPGPQATLAGENLILRAAVSVSDPDALGTDPFRVTLTATHGRVQLPLPEVAGVAVVAGANNSPAVTIEGTLDAINAVLARVKFKPDLGYVGPAALTITSNDLGNRGGPPATDTDVIPIAVLPNLTPTLLDLDADDSSGAVGTGYQTAYNPGSPAVPVADPADAIILDPDSTTFASITVTLRNAPDGAGEVLAADTTGTFLTATYANGVLTVSGEDTTAAFQQVLRTVTYQNLAAAPTPGDRVITFVVNDGYSDSNTATATVTVNGRPVAVADSYSTGQDTPLAVPAPGVLANDADPDGDPLTATLVRGPANGTVTLNPDGSFTYAPAAGFGGSDSFTYQAGDGASSSGPVRVDITVHPTPTPPVPPEPEPTEEPPAEEPPPPPNVGNPPARPEPKPGPVEDPPTGRPGGTPPGPGPTPVFTVPVGAVDLGPVGFISAPGDLAPAPVNLPAASVVPDPPVLPPLPTIPGPPGPPARAGEVPVGPILVPPPEVSAVPLPRVLPPAVEAALSAGLSELKEEVRVGVQARAVADVAVATGVVATAGYVFLTPKLAFWLLSALLARRTVWKPFDPLDVVYAWENDRDRRPPDDPDDESLASLVGEGKEP